MNDSQDARQISGSAQRASRFARSLGRFVVAVGLASASIWGYVRLGAGAAGFGGLLLLLAPGALFVSAFLIPKFKSRVRARWASLFVGLALPYLLVSCELPEWAGRRPFNPVAWRAAAGGRFQDRIRQVDDLLASGALDRRSRAAVLDLLGPDDSAKGTGWGRGYFADWESAYWLGNERGWMSIDSEWLVLRFNAGGNIAEYRIVRD